MRRPRVKPDISFRRKQGFFDNARQGGKSDRPAGRLQRGTDVGAWCEGARVREVRRVQGATAADSTLTALGLNMLLYAPPPTVADMEYLHSGVFDGEQDAVDMRLSTIEELPSATGESAFSGARWQREGKFTRDAIAVRRSTNQCSPASPACRDSSQS